MRQPLHVLRFAVLLWVLSVSALAHADDRADARTHYQTAAKMYQGGDYRGAIREFSAAQQLVPADLNNYNLALCYDKLGDAEPAMQYYRAFLDKQPGTDKKAEIQASIDRLDAALKSASAKKADEAKRAEDAKKAEDNDKRPVLGPAAPDPGAAAAGVAAGAAGAAAAGGASIAVGPAPAPTAGPEAAPAPSEAAPAPAPAPRKKHKGPAVAAPTGAGAATTGDTQLDRINGLNIDEIRDQRLGAQGEAAPPNGANGPAVAGTQQPGQLGQANAQLPVAPANDEPKKESPVYKKWWFWAVVAVGGYVVYQLATSSSSSSSDTTIHPGTAVHHAPTAGLTLLHF